MTSVLHTVAMQNTTQQSGGSLGVSIEIVGATVLACVLLTATVLVLTKFRRRRDPMFFREPARPHVARCCCVFRTEAVAVPSACRDRGPLDNG